MWNLDDPVSLTNLCKGNKCGNPFFSILSIILLIACSRHKILCKTNLRKARFILVWNFRVRSIMVRDSWLQQLEGDSFVASIYHVGLGAQNQVVGLGGKFPLFQYDRILWAQTRANEEVGRCQGKVPHSLSLWLWGDLARVLQVL